MLISQRQHKESCKSILRGKQLLSGCICAYRKEHSLYSCHLKPCDCRLTSICYAYVLLNVFLWPS